jgi:hypothetical protein
MADPDRDMAPAPSLHRQLMSALVRSAQAQEDSRTILAENVAIDARLRTTLAETHRGRTRRARDREVRIRTH